jgi:hypothetical protein
MINKPFILAAIPVVSMIIGLFVFLKPELTIEIQRKFYEKINWRIEPISMPKEIRNTKIMGMFLVAVAVVTMIFYCLGGIPGART